MITIKSVEIHNFFSITKANVSLDNLGITSVKGINKDDTVASNGSGKSAFSESIGWAITGETTRGTKDIGSFITGEPARVIVELDIDGKQVIIDRGLKLYIQVDGVDISSKGTVKTQESLLSIFPELAPDTFSIALGIPQGYKNSFVQGTGRKRCDILTSIEGIDRQIDDISTRLKESLKRLDVQEKEAIRKQSEGAYYRQVGREIENHKQLLESLGVVHTEEEIVTLKKNIAIAELILATPTDKNIQTEYSNKKQIQTMLKSSIDNYKEVDIHSVTCDKCGSPLPQEQIDMLVKQHNELQLAHEQRLTRLAELDKELVKLDKELAETENLLDKKRRATNYLLENKPKLVEMTTTTDRAIDIQTEIDTKSAQYNQLSSLYNIATAELQRIDAIKSVLLRVKELLKVELKAKMLMSTVTQLSEEVDKLTESADFGKINLVVDEEGQVLMEYNRKPVANLSGGEQKIVELICQIALRNMIIKKTGNISLCYFDESFDGCDAEAMTKMVKLIAEISATSILIITHKHHAGITYDNSIVAKKYKGETEIYFE